MQVDKMRRYALAVEYRKSLPIATFPLCNQYRTTALPNQFLASRFSILFNAWLWLLPQDYCDSQHQDIAILNKLSDQI